MQAKQAALVAMRPDGAVRAIMGGRSHAESTFNRATKAQRSPGSAFKPFVYLTALEQGYARDTIRYDEPIAIKDWAPDNFDGSHSGPMTLQAALVRSVNTVAVGLGQEVGLPAVISTAQRLGIKSELQPNASLALGTSEVTPLELTAAYASFASVGLEAVPHTVTEIRAADGTVLYQRMPLPPRRVITEENALAMNAMLFEVVQSGTGRGAALRGREVGGKTGTSTDYRDAWFIGFTPELVAGVWVGNDNSTPMKRVTGGALPAQIWGSFMLTSLKGQRPTPLPRAEPIYEPLIAEFEDEAPDGFFDRLGNLLDRIIGERRTAPAPPPETIRPQVRGPEPQARLPEPQVRADQDDGRYAYQPRSSFAEPPRASSPEGERRQVREREPRVGADQDYARDRYAYQPRNRYTEPRRGYGYYDDPRNRPRYGYGGYYDQEPRREREPALRSRVLPLSLLLRPADCTIEAVRRRGRHGMSIWARSWSAAICLLIALVAGCGPDAPNVPQPGKPQTRIVFVTDWKAQAEHGGFYQALAEGLYAKRGLDVAIRQGGPAVNVPQLLAGGAADFGMGSNGFIPLNLVREGVKVKAVMAVFQKDPQVLITHPRDDVKSIADMKGKPILIGDASTVTFWPWLKAKFGFTDTQIRKYTFNLAPFLVDKNAIQEGYLSSRALLDRKSGRLHAAGIPARGQRLSRLRQHGAGARQWIAERPQVVQAFVDATIEGWMHYLYGDPSAGNALIKQDNPEMTDDLIAQAIEKMKTYGVALSGDAESGGLGAMTDARWQEFLRHDGR